MLLKIKKEILINLIRKIYGGVSRNTTKKNIIYSNILIKVTKEKIFCISANAEIEILVYEKTSMIDEIEILVPFKTILAVCRISPKGSIINIHINEKNNKIEILVNNNKVYIQRINDNYPLIIRDKNNEKFITIENLKLKENIKKTILFHEKDDSKIYLNGMLMTIKDNNLRIISCDHHRISIINIMLNDNYKESEIIMPKKTAKQILDIFPDNEYTTIFYTNNYVRLITKNLSLTSKLLNTNFPNIDEIIKEKGEKKICVEKNLVKQAISFTNIVKADKNKKMKIILTKNNMTIFASNDIEESITNIRVKYSSNNMEIGVNLKYIADIINVIASKNIYMTFSNPTKPIFIKEENFENEYIIMPINL